jgi:putative transposase
MVVSRLGAAEHGHANPVMKSLPLLHLEQFHFYRPEVPVRRVRRDLPHWEQDDVCAFVTFRMADALPASVIGDWLAQRKAWLVENGINPADKNWKAALEEMPEDTVSAFHRRFTTRLHELLDAGHGECLLRRPDLRSIARDALMHWHGVRCLLAGWVIMPNHVHVLLQPMGGYRLLDLCASWKQWTARRINQALGRSGHFWQGESWDHLLRRAPYLLKYRKYVRLNPVKARLPAEEYTLWLPEIEGLIEE